MTNDKPQEHLLIRGLGLGACVALGVCDMIGQGVFLKARAMTCNVGAPWIVMAAWLLAGLLALCGALTLAELGAMMPESGGPYAFLRRAFAPQIGFAYGWMMLFLGGPLSAAALAAGGAIFLNLQTGGALDAIQVPLSLGFLHGNLAGTQAVALALIGAIAVVNLAPVRTNGAIATVLAAVKILVLVTLTVGAFLLGSGSFHHFAMNGNAGLCAGIAASARGGAAGFGAAMVGALYAYQGWSSLTYVAGEIKEPSRTLPLALVATMLVVMTVYIAANAAYFYVLTPLQIASTSPASSVGLEVFGHIFGPAARGVATSLLFVSVLSTLHVTILTNSRITFALADDDDLVPWLAHVSSHARVPSRAVMLAAVLAAILVVLGTFDVLSDFEIFSVWIFYGLVGLSLFVLRRKEPDAPRPFRIAGYPWIPAAFCAATAWLLFEAVIDAPARSLLGLGIIALSLPVYRVLRARKLRRRGAAPA
ncbi:MAG: amino acid permease [Candidatus Eremiobacteraeota bacterium]|nr:amino acid permease [Candidatus Eremiobacteraeota bacterium]MBV8596527.1 amino acid permease [Candidatus Eremiobacteraeota bacterium]